LAVGETESGALRGGRAYKYLVLTGGNDWDHRS